MLRRLCWVLSLGVVVCGLSGSAFAAFGTPDWWQDVQFGGSGIVGDSSQMVYDQFNVGSGTVRLALMAHGRYGQSPVYAVAPGIYYVETGKYGGTGYDKDYAKWNFGFYVAAGSVSQFLGVKLFYDFDPGENTGTLNYAWLIANFSQISDDPDDDDGDQGQNGEVAGEVENSWNLAMNFLTQEGAVSDLDQNGLIDGTSYNFPFPKGVYVAGVKRDQSGTFDPNKNGEYTFKLAVYFLGPSIENSELNPESWGDPSGEITMQVNAVPEPATLVGLASLGATGLGGVVLRRRKKA